MRGRAGKGVDGIPGARATSANGTKLPIRDVRRTVAVEDTPDVARTAQLDRD
jgi:hypothetical protein